MTRKRPSATNGMKAAAVLIAWMSLAQIGSPNALRLPETAYNAMVMLTSIAGVIVAAAIWVNAKWMIFVYAAWLVFALISRIWHDARLASEAWEVAAGGLLVAAIFGIVGYLIFREQQRLAGA